jgi:hypothetical protein
MVDSRMLGLWICKDQNGKWSAALYDSLLGDPKSKVFLCPPHHSRHSSSSLPPRSLP